ncbi:MAG: TPM domain-containing protein [Candidatus Acidiferrales bacterium]
MSMPRNPDFRPFFLRFGHRVATQGLLALLTFCFAITAASAQTSIPAKPTGYVDDYANVLSPNARAQLTALCTEVDQKAKAQIFVVTVTSLNGQPIEDFSLNLATKWGVGPKQTSSGVLLLFAIQDHRYRVEVGYGLESILPDGKVGGFGREALPYLRNGNYDAAVMLVTRRIADVIAQDRGVKLSMRPLPAGQPAAKDIGGLVTFIVLGALIFMLYLMMRVSRDARRPGGGSWWIGPTIGMGGGGWGGGGFGGGFGGGGGGGGFSGGGGGSFGGGGASGSW